MADSRRAPARRHPNRGRGNRGLHTNGPQRTAAPAPAPPRVSTPPLTETIPLDTPRFADLAKKNLLHPILLQTITEDLKFDHMMPVQAKTLEDLLSGRLDMLAQAKTGTGKTSEYNFGMIMRLADLVRDMRCVQSCLNWISRLRNSNNY